MMLLHPYNDDWPLRFAAITQSLLEVFDAGWITIEHVGSTSVPGLLAKDIIDIDIVYDPEVRLSGIVEKLTSLGYYHAGDQGIAQREVFKRLPPQAPHPVLDRYRHHLYACPAGGLELLRHLSFRDQLRQNPEAKKAYAELKLMIATEAEQDQKRYAALKEKSARSLIEQIMAGHFNKR